MAINLGFQTEYTPNSWWTPFHLAKVLLKVFSILLKLLWATVISNTTKLQNSIDLRYCKVIFRWWDCSFGVKIHLYLQLGSKEWLILCAKDALYRLAETYSGGMSIKSDVTACNKDAFNSWLQCTTLKMECCLCKNLHEVCMYTHWQGLLGIEPPLPKTLPMKSVFVRGHSQTTWTIVGGWVV